MTQITDTTTATTTTTTTTRVFSVDAETDGLYGRPFAIAAIVYEGGIEVSRFEGRLPDSVVSNGWVQGNVLPALVGWEPTHKELPELLEAFWAFYAQNSLEAGQWGLSPRKDTAVIAHCGTPVEAGLFRRCVEQRPEERTFQGPLPIHEVGTLLLAAGENPASCDSYLEKHGLERPEGSPHHPTYDAAVAASVWEHLRSRISAS